MSHQIYKISGVPIMFPGKPYPSQFSMMDRIIKGIERRQHCLLESPTGSGKSLALLCSSLAWLQEEKTKKSEEDQEEIEKATCVCACHVAGTAADAHPSTLPPKSSPDTDTVADKGLLINDDDNDDDFKKDSLNFNTKLSDKKIQRKHISIEYEPEEKTSSGKIDKPECTQCSCTPSGDQGQVKRRIPKIFFCTRTHKQVAQIVRELRKTEYRDVNMTVLGSREHTCIHPVVSKSKSKDDGCRELLGGPGCPFENKVHRYKSHSVLQSQGLASAWDLEDLVKFGKMKKVCPYFLSRSLKEEADLVICPYNYLVDPLIRDSLPVSLKGQVVILDEAHNIEDSAREAASQTISQESIESAIKDVDELMTSHNLAEYSRLIYVLRKLLHFIEENKETLDQKDFNQAYKIWNGFHIVAQLESMGLGPGHFKDLKKAFTQIKMDTEERKEESKRTGKPLEEMKRGTQNVFDQLFLVMDFMYRQDLKYVDDYRASLVHSVSYVPRQTENQWLNSRNKNGGRKMVQVDTMNLNFWCMNPAVTFSDFVETRSVILTSGTLSPMGSFQSELGLDFKIQLEANHIIKDSQVWVGSLGQGPNGTSLMAVYRNIESLTFQDELGQAVLQVCKSVPHGNLCFLPSYKVLDKLYTRWEVTGLLDRIGERKKVFREPRSSSKEEFEEQIASYYRAVENANDPDDDTDGAIMFAVCRGKISEGMDFADDYARAVISVGIPYPNFKDLQVELKRKYNDSHRQDRGLLSGSDWYDIQGFRALNQALGRCIRHRNDWGALIIIDERFVKSAPKYAKGLSKWVRNKLCTHENYFRGMNSLKEFITRCEEEEKERKLNLPASQTPVTPNASCLDTSNVSLNASSLDIKDEDVKGQQEKPETPKWEPPKSSKQFSIFNMVKPAPNSSSKKTKYPTLSSISSPSSKNIPNPHQLPTAVVHPSFIIPPRPLAPISNVLNNHQPAVGHIITTPQPLIRYVRHPAASLPGAQPSLNDTKTNSLNKDATAFTKQITNPSPSKTKTTIQIITGVAPPGTRMQVFDIDPSLHEVFGGNLNLPVSTTERLVYMVEPPHTPGGNPLARIIRMSKEEKEKLAKESELIMQLQKERNTSVIETNKPSFQSPSTTNHSSKPLPPSHNRTFPTANATKSGYSKDLLTNNGSKQLKNTDTNPSNIRICNNNNVTASSITDTCNNNEDGTQESLEEEPTSSCSLFDSPATTTTTALTTSHTHPRSPHQPKIIENDMTEFQNDHSGKNTVPDSMAVNVSKKNPLLKFMKLSSTKAKDSTNLESKPLIKSDNTSIISDTINVSTDLDSTQISPELFGSNESPSSPTVADGAKDLKPNQTRKPLFRMSDKRSALDNTSMTIGNQNDLSANKTSSSKVVDSETNDDIHSSTSIRFASTPVIPAGNRKEKEEDGEEEEIGLRVKRKCGRKRRSLSLRAGNEDKKKLKSERDDSAGE